MRRHRIAAMGGDGIGPEVIAAGCRVLAAAAEADGGFAFDVQEFDWGSGMYRRTGRMMPADGLDRLRDFDAIFFGAVGAPDIPDHITLWELRLAICQGFDQYANVRPTRLLPGVVGPLREDLGRRIDWVIVRENSEGEYAGVGGRAHRGLPIEVGMDVAVFTRAGVERICRYSAFDITGKGIANPLGSFWTGAMLLEHLGEGEAARRVMRAVEAVTARGEVLTPDLGGKATTAEVTEAVIAALRGANL